MSKHTTHYACQEQLDKYGGKTIGCCCTGHECKQTSQDKIEKLVSRIAGGAITREKGKQQINKLLIEAVIEELEELKSYDWCGTDDHGNENVYFNDEVCTYANNRISELTAKSKANLNNSDKDNT